MARVQIDTGSNELLLGATDNDGTGTKAKPAGGMFKAWAAAINAMMAEIYGDTPVDHAGDVTLVSGDAFKVHTNRGAEAIRTWSLPPGSGSLRYTAQRVPAYALRLDPNGSEAIGDGGAGKYLEIRSAGRITVQWMTDRWEIIEDGALYNFEA